MKLIALTILINKLLFTYCYIKETYELKYPKTSFETKLILETYDIICF